MFCDLAPVRKVFLMSTVVCLVFLGSWAMAAGPDTLEGTGGAPAADPLSALEGTAGHGAATAQPLEDGVACQPPGPCMEVATQLPLRVLSRPFSHLYREMKAGDDTIVLANIAAFQPLYVFDRQGLDMSKPAEPSGWYQVGRSRTAAEGWMQAKDLLEWRQALLVSYTHPGNPLEGRSPVLMFRDRGSLEAIVDDMDMAGKAKSIYEGIGSGNIPESVVSMEPQRFVDITRQFYVLPILQWSQTQINGDDVRLLQLAAAVPRSRGGGYPGERGISRSGPGGPHGGQRRVAGC